MSELRAFPWPTVAVLVAVALVRPLLSITGADDALGRPLTPLLATVVIAVVWVALAVARLLAQPVAVLAVAGVGYGVCAVLGNFLLQPLIRGDASEFMPPAGVVAVIGLNAAYGAVLGLIAQSLIRRRAAS